MPAPQIPYILGSEERRVAHPGLDIRSVSTDALTLEELLSRLCAADRHDGGGSWVLTRDQLRWIMVMKGGGSHAPPPFLPPGTIDGSGTILGLPYKVEVA